MAADAHPNENQEQKDCNTCESCVNSPWLFIIKPKLNNAHLLAQNLEPKLKFAFVFIFLEPGDYNSSHSSRNFKWCSNCCLSFFFHKIGCVLSGISKKNIRLNILQVLKPNVDFSISFVNLFGETYLVSAHITRPDIGSGYYSLICRSDCDYSIRAASFIMVEQHPRHIALIQHLHRLAKVFGFALWRAKKSCIAFIHSCQGWAAIATRFCRFQRSIVLWGTKLVKVLFHAL